MRILVVEDEPKSQAFIQKSLEAECFAVDTAADGLAGEQLATLNEYDLLILDNNLPGKNGLDICADLRRSGMTTPILILSVITDTDIKVRALDNGADDYLTKPFSLTELIARVRALLRRQPVIEDEVITINNLVINTRQHTVTRDSEPVKLTRKEFMLLEYLVRNRGTVLSRGMIMEHVWDMNADPFSNTIESHILSLRKKLEQSDRNAYIKTVSGLGYKFE